MTEFSEGDLNRADLRLEDSYRQPRSTGGRRDSYQSPLAVLIQGRIARRRCKKCGAFDQWKEKSVFGTGRNKVVLEEPLLMCRICEEVLEESAVEYRAFGQQRSGWDGGARLTGPVDPALRRRPVPGPCVYVKASRPYPGSAECRILGDVEEMSDRVELVRHRQAFERSTRTYWPARCYIAFVMGSARGTAAVLRNAVQDWTDYPLPWTYHEVKRLIDEGRAGWCERLVRANLL